MGDKEDEPCGFDRVIEAYQGGIDESLLIENLRLTPLERLRKHEAVRTFMEKNRGRARIALARARPQ